MKHRTTLGALALFTLFSNWHAQAQPKAAPDIVLDKSAQVSATLADPSADAALKWSGPQDLSARLWARREGVGANRALVVTIAVRDDVFDQPFPAPEAWQGDSVQVAFEVPNQKGHWEIGLSRQPNGTGALALFGSPDQMPDPLKDVAVTAVPVADGILYTARLPFRSFGLSDAILNRGVRFNFLVNDSDGAGKRESYIALTSGIGDNKNTEPFYTLLFAANSMQPKITPPSPEYTLDGPLTTRQIAGPAWARNLTIYQAFPHDFWTPQYQQGSYFKRTQALLPALKEMGVGIVWLLPLHPRGNAPGTAKAPGISQEAQVESDSPYSVRDYYAIDNRLGTPDDLKSLVRQAHAQGLRIITDWVPNHTSWGNALLREHPDWYKRDAQGNIDFPSPWKDIAQLDFGNRAVWDYQRDALTYWLREYDIDGFRMDAAGRVPIEFWTWLRPQLERVKPVFMLAEADEPRHHPALDATYNWQLQPLLWGLARHGVDDVANKLGATAIDNLLKREARDYPAGAIRMLHLDNHDLHFDPNPYTAIGAAKNKMEGGGITIRYGNGLRAFSVLTATLPGKPMVFNGEELQEPNAPAATVPATPEALRGAPYFDFYKRLLSLYRDNPALQLGAFTKIPSGHDEAVYAFARRAPDGHQVVVVLNLSDVEQNASLQSAILPGRYRELFTDRDTTLTRTAAMKLEPWTYRVYVRR